MKKVTFIGMSAVAVLLLLASCNKDNDQDINTEPPTNGSGVTGTAQATVNGVITNVNWVQLWDGGPKFAEFNVGANSVTDYGGYYAWGGSQDKVDDHINGTSELSGNNDTATKLWGSNWRMPTQIELNELLDKCNVEWTTVSGVEGCKFTGKSAYASSSVFLPAAGASGSSGVSGQGDYGLYWSSTPDIRGEEAYYLRLISEKQKVKTNSRYIGYSVRAVLAE